MSSARAAAVICLAALACAPDHHSTTGGSEKDPTWHGTQSETATAVASNGPDHIVYVSTYNDDTDDGHVSYTTTDRLVKSGASMLGWSYSLDRGVTWTYGGKVKPPKNIGALWGDPAIVVPRDHPNRVYITSLAVPDAGIPPGGHTGTFTDGTITYGCIARSDDAGIHFAIQTCVSSGGDFYDGSSMAAGNGEDPRVFAAFENVDKGIIDVWASADGIAPFVKVAGNPFPNMTMASHPRLAYDHTNGDLLVAAITSGQLIYMNRLIGNSWQTPVLASNVTTRIDIKVGSQTIRMAYGFSFDVGAPSQVTSENGDVRIGDDAIRMMYTTRDAETQRLYVRGSKCRADLSICRDAPEWGTTPGNLNTPRDQWNPTVKAWPGFIGLPPEWKATYQTTDDTPNGVSIKQGNLAVLPDGTPIFLPFNLVAARPICPDFRNGSAGGAVSGYWGDYDEAVFAGFDSKSTAPQFLLSFSDSSKGCVSQFEFTSTHLHVSSVVYQ